MTERTFIASVAKVVDNHGDLQGLIDIQQRIASQGFEVAHLVIEPISSDWHKPLPAYHFRSGCAPIEALNQAQTLLANGHHAVLISGEDHIRSGYSKALRQSLMAVYGQDYPLTQAYTDLAKQFMSIHDMDTPTFKHYCELLFDNHKRSYAEAVNFDGGEHQLPGEKWYAPVTELFRGVDCANPLIDFSASVLVCSEYLVDKLALNRDQCVEVAGIGMGVLDGDGPEYIQQIAKYAHLTQAFEQGCTQAGVDFNHLFYQGLALLESYTCYPVVPMGFLLASGLVKTPDELPRFLQHYPVTITGGMNLARAPWNNPALNGIIVMVQRLQKSDGSIDDKKVGLVHANGGLGYRQGVVILRAVED